MSGSVERAHEYARSIVSGEINACRWVQLACQRHLDDLGRADSDDFPYVFDEAKAERVLRFIELLPHVKGRWALKGKTLSLEPWQSFVVCNLFGWVHRESGLRRFRISYVEVPRKNGKSTLAAAIGLRMFAADGEAGAEVYSGATTEAQAFEVFRPAWDMAKRSEELRRHLGIEQGGTQRNPGPMYCLRTGSRFAPVIGKPGDGASPHCAIVDEYHEHQSDALYDTMLTGMGAREQPLMFVITTAGSDTAGPCYNLRADVLAMLEGNTPRDELFGIIYTLDLPTKDREGDDWTAPESLAKANPNYGVSVSREFLQMQVRDAVASSRKQNVVKTKHFNVWVGARESWMNMEAWAKCADAPPAETFAGKPCWIGLDLSSKIDIAARVKVFEEGGHYYAYCTSYLPEKRAMEPDCQHYQGWVHDGWLKATEALDGTVIDHRQIAEDIQDDAKRFSLARAGCDPYGILQIQVQLSEESIEVVEVPQTVAHLSEPMKWVEALVKAGRLHHAGDPCFTWQVSNVVARIDANDNVFPRKERRENKIDGAVALIIAMGQAMSAKPKLRSIYEERGVLSL